MDHHPRVHKMPEVAPESGTFSLNYSKPLGGPYTFVSELYKYVAGELKLRTLRTIVVGRRTI